MRLTVTVMMTVMMIVQVTPKISATEAAALEAGTIGFDRDIFDGTASLQSLKDKYPLAKLSDREQAFLDNEVLHMSQELLAYLYRTCKSCLGVFDTVICLHDATVTCYTTRAIAVSA